MSLSYTPDRFHHPSSAIFLDLLSVVTIGCLMVGLEVGDTEEESTEIGDTGLKMILAKPPVRYFLLLLSPRLDTSLNATMLI